MPENIATILEDGVAPRALSLQFNNVDGSAEPEALIRRLDRVEKFAPHIAFRELTYQAVPGGPGIDLGCGHGRAVAELVQLGVPATGVDSSQVMVRAARQRFPQCTFRVADAAALPFADASMRWYRAERVYMHVPDPKVALAEARRVIAPGGTIILADPDLDTAVITSNDPHLTTKIVTAFTDSLSNGRAGSRGPGLLAQAGFSDITVNAVAMAYADMEPVGSHLVPQMAKAALDYGVASRRQVITWMEDLHRLNEANQFLIAYTVFLTTATTPHRR